MPFISKDSFSKDQRGRITKQGEEKRLSSPVEVALATDQCGGRANIGMRMLAGQHMRRPSQSVSAGGHTSLAAAVLHATPTTHNSIRAKFIVKRVSCFAALELWEKSSSLSALIDEYSRRSHAGRALPPRSPGLELLLAQGHLGYSSYFSEILRQPLFQHIY